MTFANSLHSGTNGASASFAVVSPHKQPGESVRSVNSSVLYRLLAGFRPLPRKSLTEVYILLDKRLDILLDFAIKERKTKILRPFNTVGAFRNKRKRKQRENKGRTTTTRLKVNVCSWLERFESCDNPDGKRSSRAERKKNLKNSPRAKRKFRCSLRGKGASCSRVKKLGRERKGKNEREKKLPSSGRTERERERELEWRKSAPAQGGARARAAISLERESRRYLGITRESRGTKLPRRA